jgi:alpha-L-fucosidase
MYQPTRESVQQHPVPEWYHTAKLGIFIHWGLYSVPAYAPLAGDFSQVLASGDWATWFANNPYAEWYMNSYQIAGSPTQHYHQQEFGAGFPYADFAPRFNQAVQGWDPAAWATLFQQVGARYVVLTTKHHDGFLLWPSRQPNPFLPNYHAERDLVGELTGAIRAHGMEMGLYYSGGLDWTFNPKVIQHIADIPQGVPQSAEYVAYANGHWRELIDRYQTAILWNDIAYPAATNLNELFADYYNQIPHGLVNNRFAQKFEIKAGHQVSDNHFDFETPEYSSFAEICTTKWESCRGIGASFGYNQLEGPEHYQSVENLVRLLVDIVSKNGNLLLNIGPTATGEIPELQRERLLGLGAWLRVNGEAIFETQPWHTAEGNTAEEIAVRFTQRADHLYATLLAAPNGEISTLLGLRAAPDTVIHLLGDEEQPLPWTQTEHGLAVTLPRPLTPAPAHVLRMTPQPSRLAA